MATRNIGAALLTMSLAAPVGASERVEAQRSQLHATSAPNPTRPPARPTSYGSTADARRYAAREAASPEARNYRAGDVIVISATTLIIILLVILIIVLI